MKIIGSFLKGATLPLRATKIFFKDKSYWQYVSIPIIINFFLYIASFWFFWNYLLPMSDTLKVSLDPGAWYLWLEKVYNWCVSFATVITMLAVSAFSFIYVLLIVEAPFLALLSERVEKELYGNDFDASGVKNIVKSILLGLKNSVVLGVITLFWTVVFFVGNLIIPGVSTVLGVLVIGFYYGISFLVYSAELRFTSYSQLRVMVKRKKLEVLGLGVVCYLIVLIPFIAIIFLPIAVMSGTMLYNEVLITDENKNLDS